MHIRNPVEWGVDQIRYAGAAVDSLGHRAHERAGLHPATPIVRHIGAADLVYALRRGFDDFAAFRSDVVFLCVVYPVAGLVLGRLAFGYNMLPLLFPLASGFALVGPFAAIGLYEMSRRREQGVEVGWADTFDVFRSPAIGAILGLGLLLVAIFLLWLGAAAGIYALTLGPQPPASLAAFAHDVLATERGWALIGTGIAAGFVFAVLALTIGVVSFPLLLDREATFATAVSTSIRAVLANPGTMALWGAIVAGGLVLGSIPLLVGLIVVMPVLGHATWHLYRRVVMPG
jgi:uncharacterized membrane protein